MATFLTVTYEDGTVEDIRIKPAGIIAAERKWGGSFPTVEGTCYAAWFMKGQPGGDFDAWFNALDDAYDHRDTPAPLAQAPSPEG